MPEQITASLVIAFGLSGSPGNPANANKALSIELDSRAEGYNKGKSSFAPGEYAYFLVFASQGLRVDVVASAGQVSFVGNVVIDKTETVTFAGSNTATLSAPPQNIKSVSWMGNNLGGVSLGADKVTLTASGGGVGKIGVAEITYSAVAKVYGLGSPIKVSGHDNFTIAVLATGT